MNVNVPLAVVYAVAPQVRETLAPRRIAGLTLVSVGVSPTMITLELEPDV